MSMTATATLVCSRCGERPKKQSHRKDGTLKLPYRWVREEGEPVCAACRTPDDPACNLSFKCRIDSGMPIVEDQMRGYNRYVNALVAMERDRRARSEAAIRQHAPQILVLDAAVAEDVAALEQMRATISQGNATARKRRRLSPAEKEVFDAVKARLKDNRAKLKEARGEVFALKDATAAVEEWANSEQKRVRKACGLYSGTYLLAERAATSFRSGAPPRFRRFEGQGRVGVQIQDGITVAEAWQPNRYIRFEETGRSNQGGPQVRAWVRVDSDDDGKPVWASVLIRPHGQLPDAAVIKWAEINRTRVGHDHYRYSLILTVRHPDAGSYADRASEGIVGIDLGWALLDDGRLRVAAWVGSDDQRGEVCLPANYIERKRKVEEVQGTEKDEFNKVIPVLANWLATHDHPDWFKEQTERLLLWKSERRLAGVVLFWRTNRFAGDEDMFAAMETWRKRDKHLQDYHAFLRKRMARQRQAIFRVEAAKLRRLYESAHIEDINWKKLAKQPEAEEAAPDVSREYMRLAAPGKFAQEVTRSMAATVRIDPAYTTARCHRCKKMDAFDGAERMRTCRHCGETDDQDWRAATNLRDASGEVVDETPVAAREQ